MRKIKLVTLDGKIIYEAHHNSIKDAIEFAITHSIPMDGVDLSHTNLKNINLDGADLKNASFCEADLSGANMSEANFKDCNFSGANMTDVCLCYSNLQNCNLKYATFGATDISMASLIFCSFEGISAFQIPFHLAFHLSALTYYHYEKAYIFHSTPTLVKSGENYIAILEKQIFSANFRDEFSKNKLEKNHLRKAIEEIQSAIVSQ